MWLIFGSLARSVAWLFDHWYFGCCLARRSGQFNDWFRIAFCVLAHTNACMHKLSSSYTGEEELISSAWLACDVWPWHRCKWPVVVSVDDWRDWREGKHQSIGTRNHRMIFWSVLSLFSDHKTRLNSFREILQQNKYLATSDKHKLKRSRSLGNKILLWSYQMCNRPPNALFIYSILELNESYQL